MKKTIYNIGILLFAVVLFGCEDFLDRKPLSEVTDQTYYQNEQEMKEALTACYDVLQWEDQWANNPYHDWMIGDICSDDAEKGGQSEKAWQDELIEMTNFTIKSSNVHLEIAWKNAYLGIFRCNIFLDKLKGVNISDEVTKKKYEAEARFLRAYWYFKLNTIFGGVLLVKEVLSPTASVVERSSVSDIYAFVESDLEFAGENLMLKSNVELGRVTKGAAYGLLIKVLVFQEKYSEAKQVYTDLFPIGEYELAPDYASIFVIEGEFGSGSIFEINYLTNNDMSLTPGFWYIGTEGSAQAYWISPVDDKGKGYCQVSLDFINEYEMDDPRQDATVSDQYEVSYGTGYFNQKVIYSDGNPYPEGSLNPQQMSGVNKRILRLADVYLLYAEACYHTSDEGTAREFVNKIRKRASGNTDPAILQPIHQSVTGQDLIDAIYRERRIELGLEGHRFYDLVRWGLAPSLLSGFTAGVNEVWPIPFEEVQKSNGKIKQNNGYN